MIRSDMASGISVQPRIIACAPNMGGKRKGEGSVLGVVGDMIDGR